jgi:hypothetical protein
LERGSKEGQSVADFGVSAEVFSGVAVAMSMYSLWRTSLKQADLRVFDSPLVRYASPYQNSVFEVFEIPLTVINEGAQTGTILSFDLEVTNSQNGTSKLFYSAGLGPWSLARVKGEGLTPFTPVSLTGRSSQSETILFYARNDSQVMQIVEAPAQYRFAITPLTTQRRSFLRRKSKPLIFEMTLPYLDHRAFTSGGGTLPMHKAS